MNLTRLPNKIIIENFIASFKPFFFHEIFIEKENENALIQKLSSLLLVFIGEDNKENIIKRFRANLDHIRKMILLDAKAMYEGDPAATSLTEVIYAYPGFDAILSYRIAHELHNAKIPLLPRIITELSHSRTGIDIHPGAKIGKSFCIDHGTSLVIGQTAIIGDNVKLYQGVTLGAFSVKKNKSGKRHPTLKDNVTVYARSTILGGDTIIGKNAVIGGNTWITNSVPDNAVVYMKQPTNQLTKIDDE